MSFQHDVVVEVPEEGQSRLTGGQYSLLRVILALAVAGYSAAALLHGSPAPTVVIPFLQTPAAILLRQAVVVAMTLPLMLGWRDRAAGSVIGMLLIVAVLGNPWSPGAWGMLLAIGLHLLTAPAPLLSLDARGRVDPGGGWEHRPALMLIAWVLVCIASLATAIATTHHLVRQPGITSNQAPTVFLIFVGFSVPICAALASTRPLIWFVVFIIQLVALAFEPSAWSTSTAMIALLLFCFDARWIPPVAGPAEHIFFDGECGLCHGFARFLMAEDELESFRLAPLQGLTAEKLITPAERQRLPDSIIVRTADGKLLTRTAAVAHVWRRIGGMWRGLAAVMVILPRPIRDVFYDLVARLRRRIFKKPEALCPRAPRELTARLDP